ncbi:TRPL translocation defect protein 14-like [Dendronephthya gigantea]|uniref:TRPL translocation defect protein 14-like n=1 Tax=Dendronephthya gigantea TaxID=151771 RepID=UPI0010696C93|nr:TRPL translocation defect protein 14-like [Dendronephthya gigantea]
MAEYGVAENGVSKGHQIYRLALTGGPCAGKTTSQARLSTFFENLGWKVFRVPEASTILLGGGVKFPDLTSDQRVKFQENLLKTIIQLETTFFELAESCNQNCLIICDRGVMDPSAFVSKEEWQAYLKKNNWNNVKLRDERYNQVIHLVTAAKGATAFYQLENNNTRTEGLALARELDDKACQAWVGHPYFDVIENSEDFNDKVSRTIAAVCAKIGIDINDRLDKDSKKRKFLVSKPPNIEDFPPYQDFDVQHDYLVAAGGPQVRIRKRGQGGHFTYTHTVRLLVKDQTVERRKIISSRDYEMFLQQRDPTRKSVVKRRTCFLWQNQYFQLDSYCQPCNERCKGLIILETYTTNRSSDLPLPDFLEIEKEITNDKDYSMYNLSVDDS